VSVASLDQYRRRRDAMALCAEAQALYVRLTYAFNDAPGEKLQRIARLQARAFYRAQRRCNTARLIAVVGEALE
jgi:hypothetical protein